LVLFIEIFRLILVLSGALGGLELGHQVDMRPAPLIGLVLGALVGYVLGGVLGRLLERQGDRAVEKFSPVPPGEFFAGTLTGIAGLLLGVALCLPLLALVRSAIVYPIAAAVAWVFCWLAFRIGVIKGRQVVAAAGLSRILAPPSEPPPGYALLVDTSAVMDRSLLVFGRSGLLVGGLVIPRFVVDQVKTMAAGPDPVSSRRARRGLESIEVLRESGVLVHVAENELPEIDDLNERLLEIARRLGLRIATCSTPFTEMARRRGLPVIDLRKIGDNLSPDFSPGEQLVIDLNRHGNQPRQAVGYLPDGDMVVVNDAAHMIGREDVVVEVLSTRRTHQGLLVFATLAERRSHEGRPNLVRHDAGPARETEHSDNGGRPEPSRASTETGTPDDAGVDRPAGPTARTAPTRSED
jgi:uncharacterized protein YacL